MSKQERVIEHLVDQKSRHLFLSNALNEESKQISTTHKLMSVALKELETLLRDWGNRMVYQWNIESLIFLERI